MNFSKAKKDGFFALILAAEDAEIVSSLVAAGLCDVGKYLKVNAVDCRGAQFMRTEPLPVSRQ